MLKSLISQLTSASSVDEKRSVLDALPQVEIFFKERPALSLILAELTPQHHLVLKQMVAIGQAEKLLLEEKIDRQLLLDLLESLTAVDHFYREVGGIVGYQQKILELLEGKAEGESESSQYHAPSFIDISEESGDVKKMIDWGIDAMGQIAEIYPLGGAADRLHLVEENTGKELPAAKLKFAGISLLEHLVRDLQTREHLYFKKYGVQLITPIAIMTSNEKNNHAHVVQICEELNYFGRPKESIRFFTQPLVPVVDEKGQWCLAGPLKPVLKPGGHGVIWKLARDEGIFSWLESLGRTKALIRQINNPLAGLDYGLLAFAGIGCKHEMVFGFASCARLLRAAEGVNVLIEKGNRVVLSNIEYCDFKKFGIEDLPLKEGEPYSRFSSNTNILFADLKAISQAVDQCPFPGLLLNMKKGSKEGAIARLESTMQNIADVFVEEKGENLSTSRTFVTYNLRHKTISTAKKAYVSGANLQETPENCFYDLLKAHRELLLSCGFELPEQRGIEEYLKMGPEFLLRYHPALGPLYSTLREKLQKGQIFSGSELILEIADLKISELAIHGSLQIIAEQIMGEKDEKGHLFYSNKVGRCILENVQVENNGVDWDSSAPFWKMDLKRKESVRIILKGNSTFIARDTYLKGNQTFIVEDGKTMEI